MGLWLRRLRYCMVNAATLAAILARRGQKASCMQASFSRAAYHHEVVIQLRKDGLNSLSEMFVGSCGRCPVLLVQACATSWFAPTIPVIRQVSLVPGFGPKERGPEVIEVDGRWWGVSVVVPQSTLAIVTSVETPHRTTGKHCHNNKPCPLRRWWRVGHGMWG